MTAFPTDDLTGLTEEERARADDILTNMALYWCTGTAGSSGRLYEESAPGWAPPAEPDRTPTVIAVFPGGTTVRRHAEQGRHVVRWPELPRGGHHAALQAPDLFVADVREFFSGLA
ncbi:hypothetical protein [Nonomuraea gerenzanensis]|uniref:Epoxide hydrolase n=1 Tax=Nonomuraea gerenzanensis TaxID=93944 RepID=A0A1M4E9A9_9ACTN|nr:hypothetical protein [Nonomuraea gerenzanensis]UBU17655.1 hypothetical protein LCN96_22310 [Nonomuraea gerenzanensis]SBO95425.1 epoxide hydrolase [Nonomuraea gerenzanensis]